MFVTSKRGFKAQFTMKTLLEIALLLVVYSQIYPTLIEPYLNTMIADSDEVTSAILSLLPFVVACVIIIGVFSFNTIYSRRR